MVFRDRMVDRCYAGGLAEIAGFELDKYGGYGMAERRKSVSYVVP